MLVCLFEFPLKDRQCNDSLINSTYTLRETKEKEKDFDWHTLMIEDVVNG